MVNGSVTSVAESIAPNVYAAKGRKVMLRLLPSSGGAGSGRVPGCP